MSKHSKSCSCDCFKSTKVIHKDTKICGNLEVEGTLTVQGEVLDAATILLMKAEAGVVNLEDEGEDAPEQPLPESEEFNQRSLDSDVTACQTFLGDDYDDACNLLVCDKLCVGGDTQIRGKLCLNGIIAYSYEILTLTGTQVASPSLNKTVTFIQTSGPGNKTGFLENGLKVGQTLYLIGANIAGSNYVLDTHSHTMLINCRGKLTKQLRFKKTGNVACLIWAGDRWFTLSSCGNDTNESDSIGEDL